MRATSHLDTLDRPDDSDALPATTPPDGRPRRRRSRLVSGAVQGGALAVALVAAGVLFWGVPSRDEPLPDPNQMALLGANRNTSAENVEFWAGRVNDVPSSVGFRSQLAAAQLALAGDTGDLAGYELAERTARAAVDLAPNDVGATLALAAALAGQHDFTGALALADDVLADDPDNVNALLAAGDSHLELGDYAAARAHYDRAAETVAGAAPVLSRFARLESLTGSLDEAHRLARAALVDAGEQDLRPTDAAFYWFQLGTFEFNRGEIDRAVEYTTTALTIDPTHGGSEELLAKSLVAAGDFEAATARYEAMVDGGGAADLHGYLANLYDRAGRDADAAEQIRLGLAVAERDADRFPAERRHLISFLADHDPTEALRLAELDLAERQDVYAHSWYAWSLYRTGEATAAREAMASALAYGTEDATLLYQAGVIEASAGDPDRARDLLERSLDLNPNFDLVHAARARTMLATL